MAKEQVALLLAAVKAGDIDATRALLDAGVDANAAGHRGRRSLFLAARHGHAELCKLLLNAGAEVDGVVAGFKAVHVAAEHKSCACLRLLIEAGADVNAIGRWGQTPLHMAAGGGRPTNCRLLLFRGAKVDAMNVRLQTPRMLIDHDMVGSKRCAAVTRILDRWSLIAPGREARKERKRIERHTAPAMGTSRRQGRL